METFSALPAICAGNSSIAGEFLAQRPVTRSFDVCFDLRLNKRLNKHSWGWWFETLSRPLWRHSYVIVYCRHFVIIRHYVGEIITFSPFSSFENRLSHCDWRSTLRFRTDVMSYSIICWTRQIGWTCQIVKSLRPTDAILDFGDTDHSTLVHVMVSCLTVPRHYLNQCWLIISEFQWLSL